MLAEKLDEQFLIAFFEGRDDTEQLWNRLVLARVEEKLIDHLASHFPEAIIEQQADDDESKGKKKRKRKLSTQGAVKIGGKSPVSTSPETSPVEPKDVSPVGIRKQVSEGLTMALLKYAARKAASNAAKNAGLDDMGRVGPRW